MTYLSIDFMVPYVLTNLLFCLYVSIYLLHYLMSVLCLSLCLNMPVTQTYCSTSMIEHACFAPSFFDQRCYAVFMFEHTFSTVSKFMKAIKNNCSAVIACNLHSFQGEKKSVVWVNFFEMILPSTSHSA